MVDFAKSSVLKGSSCFCFELRGSHCFDFFDFQVRKTGAKIQTAQIQKYKNMTSRTLWHWKSPAYRNVSGAQSDNQQTRDFVIEQSRLIKVRCFCLLPLLFSTTSFRLRVFYSPKEREEQGLKECFILCTLWTVIYGKKITFVPFILKKLPILTKNTSLARVTTGSEDFERLLKVRYSRVQNST